MSAAINQAPGNCQCGGGACDVTINVKGCHSLPLQGATVTVWEDSTKTVSIDSGTTDSSGNVTLDIGTSDTWYLEITHSARFAVSHGYQVFTCGIPVNKTLGPASGYHCGPICVLPVADTLYLTDSIYGGPVTLTYYSGDSSWRGTSTVTTIGAGSPCIPGTCPSNAGVTIGYYYYPYTVAMQVSFPSAGGCPTSGWPGTSGYMTISSRDLTCPTAFEDILHADSAGLTIKALYNCQTVDYTVTE